MPLVEVVFRPWSSSEPRPASVHRLCTQSSKVFEELFTFIDRQAWHKHKVLITINLYELYLNRSTEFSMSPVAPKHFSSSQCQGAKVSAYLRGMTS